MEEALQRSQDNSHAPDLKVSILLDYTRGSRGWWHFPWDVFAAERRVHRPDCILWLRFARRTDQLEDHAAAVVAALHLSDAGVSVPHSRPEGAAAAAGPSALQRDHRSPAHQSLPVWRQHYHQRVCWSPDRTFSLSIWMFSHRVCLFEFEPSFLLTPVCSHPYLILFWSMVCLHNALLIKVQVFTTIARKCSQCTPLGVIQIRWAQCWFVPAECFHYISVQHTKWHTLLTLTWIDGLRGNKTKYQVHKTIETGI